MRLTLLNISIRLLLLFPFLLIALLGALLARPLQRLRDNSRDNCVRRLFEKAFTVTSKIHEIRELTHDLETMRSNIVGVNEQLQREIVEREAAEAEQKQLEAMIATFSATRFHRYSGRRYSSRVQQHHVADDSLHRSRYRRFAGGKSCP